MPWKLKYSHWKWCNDITCTLINIFHTLYVRHNTQVPMFFSSKKHRNQSHWIVIEAAPNVTSNLCVNGPGHPTFLQSIRPSPGAWTTEQVHLRRNFVWLAHFPYDSIVMINVEDDSATILSTRSRRFVGEPNFRSDSSDLDSIKTQIPKYLIFYLIFFFALYNIVLYIKHLLKYIIF